MSPWPVSILSPVGYTSSTCGYCRPRDGTTPRSSCPKTSRSFGVWLHQLSPLDYQALCDRGWRRSGNYVYKPDLQRTCCKQVSIRLDATRFETSRGQREGMRRVVKGLVGGGGEGEEEHQRLWGKGKGKGKYSRPVGLEEVFATLSGEGESGDEECTAAAKRDRASLGRYHEQRRIKAQERRRLLAKCQSQAASTTSSPSSTSSSSAAPPLPEPPLLAGRRLTHHLTTSLVPASSTSEKYALFRRYQMAVHGESEAEVSDRKGFERFLCKSSLRFVDVASSGGNGGRKRGGGGGGRGGMKDGNGDPIKYGPYHMEWRLRPTTPRDDNDAAAAPLIAVAVLDLLPTGLSSVYLFYSPTHSHLQLGHLSALREILLARELHAAGVLREPWYYMGFFIEGCSKMEYKARYRPSEVLDVAPRGGGVGREEGEEEEGEWREIAEVRERIREGQAYGWRRPRGEVTKNGKQESSAADPKPQASHAKKCTNNGSHVAEPDKVPDDEEEDEDDWLPTPPPPGILDPSSTLFASPAKLARIAVLEAAAQEEGVKPLMLANSGQTERRQVIECVAALGHELASRVVFFT